MTDLSDNIKRTAANRNVFKGYPKKVRPEVYLSVEKFLKSSEFNTVLIPSSPGFDKYYAALIKSAGKFAIIVDFDKK
ncbi:MAG: hypothetical protein ACTSWL_09765 [Promethearchaeota archaeon]